VRQVPATHHCHCLSMLRLHPRSPTNHQ